MAYRVTLHPLAKYPGPRFWAITRIPNAYHLLRGTESYRVAEIHEQYGSIVRIAPGELSFTTEDAWNDIYGSKKGKPQLHKDPRRVPIPPDGVRSIVMAHEDDEHSRMRYEASYTYK